MQTVEIDTFFWPLLLVNFYYICYAKTNENSKYNEF